ncbi:MAG: cysteine hydrolase [Methylobacteriaceae bacterium]|nr:cysteine hydrolase [Methylobacteriaceae bacterium]
MRLPSDATLLVIDVQRAIDDPKWGQRNNPQAERAVAEVIAAWRAAGLPLVHVRHDSVEPASPYQPGGPGHAFKPEALPQPGETVLGKSTTSAFVGTDLETMLTAAGRTTLVVCGVLTHNSVEATVRHAGDLGFRVFVIADACAAVDKQDLAGRLWAAEDVHALSLAHMDGQYATIVDSVTACEAARIVAARRRR